MLIQMLHLLMISEITHTKEVVALLDPFLLWPQVGCHIILSNLLTEAAVDALDVAGQAASFCLRIN